jgi:hypothetical protein
VFLKKLCFNHFVSTDAVKVLKRVQEVGFKDLSIQFILLAYDENELDRFEAICQELPQGTHINLHPNSFPFNSLNFAEREEKLRHYFVDFVLFWVPKFAQAALKSGSKVHNVVLHAGFQVNDSDISVRENVLRREKALERVVSSYKEISQGLQNYDCTLTFENGVRAETSHGRLLSTIGCPVQSFEIPYTFEEINYVINDSVNITFDFFKYFETLTFPQVDKRVNLTFKHLKYFLSSGRVLDIQISCVRERPELFARDLIQEIKVVLQQAGFAGSLTLEGYWNQSIDRLIEDLKLLSW